jgi:hypothetical protein
MTTIWTALDFSEPSENGRGQAPQAAERPDHQPPIVAPDQDVTRPTADPPGDDLDGPAVFAVEPLAAHRRRPVLSAGAARRPRSDGESCNNLLTDWA